MKTLFLRLSVVGLCGGFLASMARAEQNLETLVSFTGDNGANPESIVQGPHGNFYGTTYSGGTGGKGTLFVVPLNKALKTLVNFNGANGSNPESRLVQWFDGNLYGTCYAGGAHGKGTIFQLTPAGGFRTVVSFDGADGASPISGLLIGADGGLYGTTSNGGGSGKGTLFKISPDGRMSTIVSFTGPNGANPQGLIRGANGDFYGTTSGGGLSNDGTIFELSPTGHLDTLVNFNGANGSNPHARLGQLSDGNFYGTTYNGGDNNLGTVFTFNPKEASGMNVANVGVPMDYHADPKDIVEPVSGPATASTGSPRVWPGTGLTTLVMFSGANGSHPDSALVPWSNGFFYFENFYTNQHIKTSQIQWSGVNFCGTTSTGGAHDNGTVFQVTEKGALLTLVSFSGTNGAQLGTIPDAIIPGNDGNLYGTTYYGGHDNRGTLYRLNLQVFPPPGVAANAVTGGGTPAVVSP